MKNIFTRALALTIVFVLCAVSAFAAPTFGDVTYDLATGTLDVATSGYTAGKSATILVVKDGADLANLSANDIIYIDQVDNAVADQSYNDIPLEDRIAALNAAKAEGAADITAVNVYIGGTEVTAAIPYADEDGNPLSVAVAEEEEPEVTYTYAVTFNTASTEFASVDAAVAALVVTKNGSDGSTATLTTADYTTDTATANTIKVLVGGEEIGSIAYTIAAPVEPPVTGETAIEGYVKFNGAVAMPNALVLITKSGSAAVEDVVLTNNEGYFKSTLTDAGDYRVVIRPAMVAANAVMYLNNITLTATVAANATTTLTSTGVNYIAATMAKAGDANGDGVVDWTDYTLVTNNYEG